MATTAILTVKNLIKKYNDFEAVKGISFEVKQGEIFGLLGPNGAGKTTTLEIIETLRTKTSGEVVIDGLNIDTQSAQIKHIIGVQLQAAGFYPNLTLLQLIDLFGGLYNRSVNALEILKTVNLEEKQHAKFKELSGGQKQRFSIATTLINKPKIIFLDEPTTGLDPQARHNLWDLIKSVRDQGTTIVLTTHYMDEAEKLCDTCGIMDKGNLVAIASPEKLIENLLHSGFEPEKKVKSATLEDVFLNLTGRQLVEF